MDPNLASDETRGEQVVTIPFLVVLLETFALSQLLDHRFLCKDGLRFVLYRRWRGQPNRSQEFGWGRVGELSSGMQIGKETGDSRLYSIGVVYVGWIMQEGDSSRGT